MELKESDTDKDVIIDQLVPIAQAFVERYINYKLEEAAYTEYYDGDCSIILVKHPPIKIAPAIEIWDDPDREFGTATKVDSDDYGIDYEAGIIKLEYPLSLGKMSVKISYTHDGDADELEIGKQATIELIARKIKEGPDGGLGIPSRSYPEGSVSFQVSDWLPQTKAALDLLALGPVS
jgi:hypothetical protein